MALLGFNIILSMIAASVLQKITPRMSFGQYLLSCGRLFRYLHPTNQELRELVTASNKAAASSNAKGSNSRKRQQDKKKLEIEDESFNVPRNIDLTLDSVPVTRIDVLQLPFYVEYRWLVDFSLCMTIVYCLTELFNYSFPKLGAAEVNLCILWCFLLIGFCFKSLVSVTALYFGSGGEDTKGERSLCLSFGVVGFLSTGVLFLFTDNVLDLGLLQAYENFTANAAEYIKAQSIDVSGTRSPVVLYLFLAILYGVVAGLLTFPCIRYARMYLGALKYASESVLLRLLLHSTFVFPLFALALWIRPLARARLVNTTPQVLTEEQFESLRLWCILFWVLLRLSTLWLCLQSYLNIAYERIVNLKKEAGRINNLELQRMVARIFIYLCVAALQYLTPVLLILALTFLLKTLGQYSWLGLFNFDWDNVLHRFPMLSVLRFGGAALGTVTTQNRLAKELSDSLASVSSLFTITVQRGLWTFTLFWTTAMVFGLNCLGLVYYTKFGTV